jgi:mono/diheme cytochrome c family protein
MIFFNKKILLALGIGTAYCATQCQPNRHEEGKRLYTVHCANCHGDTGAGLGALIPPLAGADYLTTYRADLPCVIRRGLADTIVVNGVTYGGQPMPANAALSDIQVYNLLNYVGQAWGNQLPDYQLNEVRAALEKCK